MAKMISSRKGAVSIFVVVFTALLITIVTVSFARLMLREQQRASSNDLSQSAYDAALAGVEDAKRALAKYEQLTGADARPDLSNCSAVPDLLGISNPAGQGVTVGDSALQQAYTCVLIQLQTDDYLGSLGADQSQLIPLRSSGDFNIVRLEWFSRDDVAGATVVDVPPIGTDVELIASSAWSPQRPPVMEAQIVQTGTSFSLDQFDHDDSRSADQSNTNTLFLYPVQLATNHQRMFTGDTRLSSAADRPSEARCLPDISAVRYSCSVDLRLPDEPVGGGARSNVYLRIAARYNQTDFRVTLRQGTNPVTFDGVQPEVDSTGRASDLFRRVSARIETGARGVFYPDSAVEVTGNFCKTFRVTDQLGDYSTGACQP